MAIRLEDLPLEYQKQAIEKLRCSGNDSTEKPVYGKYHNQKTQRGALKFDSQKEARRYDCLMKLLEDGEIRDLKLQPDFTLFEAYTKPDGERVRAMRYRADFAYERKTATDKKGEVQWIKVVEDVKSRATRTKDYLLKKKAMQNLLDIKITEI